MVLEMFFFKQKTAYEMRISDWSSDVCSSDLVSGKDHLRGVWVNGAPSPLDRPFGWDTHLPFWVTLTAFEGKVTPGRNSLCALVEADTEGFFPVDGGAFAALVRLHRTDGRIEDRKSTRLNCSQ